MALFYVFERSFWILLKGVGYELMTFQFFAWFFRLPSCKAAPSFSCKTAKAWWWFLLKRRSRRRRHPRRKRRRRGLRRKVRQTRLNGELVWRAGVEPRTLPVNQSKTATVPKRFLLHRDVELCQAVDVLAFELTPFGSRCAAPFFSSNIVLKICFEPFFGFNSSFWSSLLSLWSWNWFDYFNLFAK